MVVVVGIVTCSRGTVLYRSRSVEKGRVGTMLALISLTTCPFPYSSQGRTGRCQTNPTNWANQRVRYRCRQAVLYLLCQRGEKTDEL